MIQGGFSMRMIISTIFAMALTSTSAVAGDLPALPGVFLNTEVKAFRKFDAETNHLTVEPELAYEFASLPLSLTVSSLLTVYETNHASGDDFAIGNILENGHKPTLDFGFEYEVIPNGQLYGETSWDFNTEDRGEVEVGLSFNF
jgi:hypothetical protein